MSEWNEHTQIKHLKFELKVAMSTLTFMCHAQEMATQIMAAYHMSSCLLLLTPFSSYIHDCSFH